MKGVYTMNLTIKPLTPDLNSFYLDYFDNQAFSETDINGPCFCTCPMQTSDEIDQMVREMNGDIKGTLRRYAAKMLDEGKINGYLAFCGDTAIGWCNVSDINKCIKNRYQFIPDFAREITIGRTMSVVCFFVAPEYCGKGVSTALLERVIADARAEGYAAVEGYVHRITKTTWEDYDYKGPLRLYEKLGFIPAAEQDGVVVMRKTLG
jgi:GNAT superfamily N-acetyltransferase